jgi:hypothetical protein
VPPNTLRKFLELICWSFTKVDPSCGIDRKYIDRKYFSFHQVCDLGKRDSPRAISGLGSCRCFDVDFVAGKAQGQGHYENEESAQGRAEGGFQILVMPVSEGLNVGKELKCKNPAKNLRCLHCSRCNLTILRCPPSALRKFCKFFMLCGIEVVIWIEGFLFDIGIEFQNSLTG